MSSVFRSDLRLVLVGLLPLYATGCMGTGSTGDRAPSPTDVKPLAQSVIGVPGVGSPGITITAVTNGADYGSAIELGQYVTVWGTNLDQVVNVSLYGQAGAYPRYSPQDFLYPGPTIISQTATQLNLLLPAGDPTLQSVVLDLSAQQPSCGCPSGGDVACYVRCLPAVDATTPIALSHLAPAFFTVDESGTGAPVGQLYYGPDLVNIAGSTKITNASSSSSNPGLPYGSGVPGVALALYATGAEEQGCQMTTDRARIVINNQLGATVTVPAFYFDEPASVSVGEQQLNFDITDVIASLTPENIVGIGTCFLDPVTGQCDNQPPGGGSAIAAPAEGLLTFHLSIKDCLTNQWVDSSQTVSIPYSLNPITVYAE